MPLSRVWVMLCIAAAELAGAGLGFTLGIQRDITYSHDWFPLPHHVPKYPDGATLRFAMVHDVIHERFPLHGKAYYEERNRRVRQALPEPTTADAKDWPLVDDLAVGLDRLGQHADAVTLMRAKLQRQLDAGVAGRDLYSSYANLGTFLILWQLDEGFADREKAKERVRESIALVRKSIAVKPDAHFGREVWQAVLEEWLLAFLDDPRLLLKYDMAGDSLTEAPPEELRRPFDASYKMVDLHWRVRKHLDGSCPGNVASIRGDITHLGAVPDWVKATGTVQKKPVPFDEPALGIIGMWRYGGGANPHFALALGEIMLRVGQRYIAWCAYERTAQLATGIPETVRTDSIAHCRARQAAIETQLSSDEVARLRPRFEAELKFGKDYQAAYQQYEANQIAAGASIDDPHFYDAYNAEHGPIASPVGTEDRFVAEYEDVQRWPSVGWTLFGAGLGAFVAAGILALVACYRQRIRPATP